MARDSTLLRAEVSHDLAPSDIFFALSAPQLYARAILEVSSMFVGTVEDPWSAEERAFLGRVVAPALVDVLTLLGVREVVVAFCASDDKGL